MSDSELFKRPFIIIKFLLKYKDCNCMAAISARQLQSFYSFLALFNLIGSYTSPNPLF